MIKVRNHNFGGSLMNRVSVVKIIGIIGLVISMLLSGCTTNSITDNNVSGNDLTATEVIRLMGNGINLGNTLEAYNHKSYVDSGVNPTSFETLWGQPVTTRDMIDDMKALRYSPHSCGMDQWHKLRERRLHH